MKKLWPFIAIAAIVVAIGIFFRVKYHSSSNSPSQQAASENNSNSASSRLQNASRVRPSAPVSSQPSTDLASRAASPIPTPDSVPGTNEEAVLPPQIVLDKARVVIHNYRTAFGENPIGTNPEITAALMGQNPKQINFVAESGLRVDGKGELVDAYGTPFFFHQLSGQEMEIHSAGADKIMWTKDDLVTK